MDSQQQTQSVKRVLVIGDHCTDIYHFGIVERLSPEAPVPILKITRSEQRPGMCENVAENLKGLGCYVNVLTQKTEIIKRRYVEEKRFVHLLRVDDEHQVDEINVQDLQHQLTSNCYDAVVISDYEKGFISVEQAPRIVSVCKERNVPIFVDTKKHDITCYQGCIIKVNHNEFENIKKFPPDTTYELIVTTGERGAEWKGKLYPTKKVQMYDVCGAGDAFLAGFVFKYLHSRSIEDAIIFANKCASTSVTHFGNFVLSKSDVV